MNIREIVLAWNMLLGKKADEPLIRLWEDILKGKGNPKHYKEAYRRMVLNENSYGNFIPSQLYKYMQEIEEEEERYIYKSMLHLNQKGMSLPYENDGKIEDESNWLKNMRSLYAQYLQSIGVDTKKMLQNSEIQDYRFFMNKFDKESSRGE